MKELRKYDEVLDRLVNCRRRYKELKSIEEAEQLLNDTMTAVQDLLVIEGVGYRI